ncbi:MAG TPA: TIGR01777 family oxidoreductase [Opitutaceae bacterium]|nr:TIGR01777 family oxidoreductase [Opitutaceae bacterium]
MRIVLAGGSGFVGGALRRRWAAAGCDVIQLVRRPARGEGEAEWAPESGRIDLARLRDCDALVNLAGENIAGGRWTAACKERIRESRVATTRLLAETLVAGDWRPRVWINASAVGFYGDGGDQWLDESAPPGRGFLASVCKDWEAATQPAETAGVRVVRLRLGAVLDPSGGMLAQLLPVFRAGFGGPIGGGHAWLSWISLCDLVAVVDTCLADSSLAGPVNAVAPAPVRNVELAAALGRALRRPAVLPLPAWVVRAAFGEMGRELLLASQRVRSAVLLRRGQVFADTTIGAALGRLG